jgi:hypothetical protein
MIESDDVRAVASAALGGPVVQVDPQFTAFASASIGEPVLVHDLSRRPSYWLAPVRLQERVVGFVRVLFDGRVVAVGSLCRDLARLQDCPEVVTGIAEDEAARRAGAHRNAAGGEVARPPVYVHDGPPGREAWLVAVAAPDGPGRWIFVTRYGMYERPAGARRDESLE